MGESPKSSSHAEGPASDVAAAMNMAFAINKQGGQLDPGDTSGKIPTEYQTYFIDVKNEDKNMGESSNTSFHTKGPTTSNDDTGGEIATKLGHIY